MSTHAHVAIRIRFVSMYCLRMLYTPIMSGVRPTKTVHGTVFKILAPRAFPYEKHPYGIQDCTQIYSNTRAMIPLNIRNNIP